MSDSCVVAIYDSFEKARDAVQQLEHYSFPSDQVSFVTHSVGDDLRHSEALQYGDESETRAAEGAGVGGLIGLLVGAPILAIPGIGPLLVAGPLATGLTGAVVGGFLGSMLGWGAHEDHVSEYEKKVRAGHLLIVCNGEPDEVASAKELLDGTDVVEVHLHTRTSADAPEI